MIESLHLTMKIMETLETERHDCKMMRLGFTREPIKYHHADWIKDAGKLEHRRTGRETFIGRQRCYCKWMRGERKHLEK
jgi:hypothetical protein